MKPSAKRPSFKRVAPAVFASATLLLGLSQLPGAWGTAYGEGTVPTSSSNNAASGSVDLTTQVSQQLNSLTGTSAASPEVRSAAQQIILAATTTTSALASGDTAALQQIAAQTFAAAQTLNTSAGVGLDAVLAATSTVSALTSATTQDPAVSQAVSSAAAAATSLANTIAGIADPSLQAVADSAARTAAQTALAVATGDVNGVLVSGNATLASLQQALTSGNPALIAAALQTAQSLSSVTNPSDNPDVQSLVANAQALADAAAQQLQSLQPAAQSDQSQSDQSQSDQPEGESGE